MALDPPQLTLGHGAGPDRSFGLSPIDRARDIAASSRLLNGLWRYAPILLLALTWEAATRLGLISRLVLPSLDSVFASWWDLLISGDLVRNGVVSLSRGAAGLGWRSSVEPRSGS